MATNPGFLLIAGLGALLLFGQKRDPAMDETERDLGQISAYGLATDGTSVIVTAAPVESMGQTITPTELAVRRSEQIEKQALVWAANAGPAMVDAGPSQGDIDAAKFRKGTFVYGGAPRPTSTASPVWNNRYGWYWVEPLTGLPVGRGGRQWSPGDTSVNMGSADVNIGRKLPPGWSVNSRGGTVFSGNQGTIADIDY